MQRYCVEVCAGGLEDCLLAQAAGADRLELNSALFLGGLTPSIGVLDCALKAGVTIPIIAMVRPRGGGFCYSPAELEVIFEDARQLLQHGAAGLAFGFLTTEGQIDFGLTERMVRLCQLYRAQSVFHRAFDCADHPIENARQLARIGCTRILTSGQASTALAGIECLQNLQAQVGDQIELCAAAGVTADNVVEILNSTGLHQVHGSFKHWQQDPTTHGRSVSYAYHPQGDYERTDPLQLAAVIQQLTQI